MLVKSIEAIFADCLNDRDEAQVTKNYAGRLRSHEDLRDPEKLEAVDGSHDGYFGLMVFDPAVDSLVSEYLKTDQMAVDSGEKSLVLFCFKGDYIEPKPLSEVENDEWLVVSSKTPVSYDLAQSMIPNKPLVFPGVVLFAGFSGEKEPVFASLGDCQNSVEVRNRMQRLFSLANESIESGKAQFATSLATKLGSDTIPYQRGGKMSVGEWLARSWKSVKENKGLLGGLLGGMI